MADQYERSKRNELNNLQNTLVFKTLFHDMNRRESSRKANKITDGRIKIVDETFRFEMPRMSAEYSKFIDRLRTKGEMSVSESITESLLRHNIPIKRRIN